ACGAPAAGIAAGDAVHKTSASSSGLARSDPTIRFLPWKSIPRLRKAMPEGSRRPAHRRFQNAYPRDLFSYTGPIAPLPWLMLAAPRIQYDRAARARRRRPPGAGRDHTDTDDQREETQCH